MNKIKQYNWVYLLVGMLVFLFAPIEIYLSSIDDVWFSIYDFAGYILLAFCFYAGVWILCELFILPRIRTANMIISNFMFCITMAAYIQGNFIRVNYGELNGKRIDWSKFRVEGLYSAGLFIVAIIIAALICVIVLKKKTLDKNKKILNILSMLMMILMIYTVAVLFITNNGFQNKNKYVATSDGRWDYSKDDNFIILLLDNYESRLLDDLLAGDDREEVVSSLEDFTYFEDAKGFYELTMLAVPQILTGEKYLNHMDYYEYLEESFDKSPFLNKLIEQGYKLNLHTSIELPQKSMVDYVDNWKYMEIGVDSHRRLLEYIYKLVGFRYLPQQLKQYCWFYTDDMEQIKTVTYAKAEEKEDAGNSFYEWNNLYFHNNLGQLNSSLSGPVFHFTHIKGVHSIRDVDSDFNYVGGSDYEVSQYETALMNIRLINQYIGKLKEEEIYDDAVIVIMADHGDITYNNLSTPPAALTPLLLIKGKGEKHDFKSSDLKVSYDDLQDCFTRLLDGNDAVESMGNIDPDRIRYVYISDFSKPEKKGREHKLIEYAVRGYGKDGQNIISTGKEYE